MAEIMDQLLKKLDDVNELSRQQVRTQTLTEGLLESVDSLKGTIHSLTLAVADINKASGARTLSGYRYALGFAFALIMALLGTYVFVN